MPNWCENRMSVSGDAKTVKEFYHSHFKKDEKGNCFFDFNTIKPMPCSYQKSDKWYNWSITNWGTKWNACECGVDHDEDGYISCDFDTAWSPPSLIIEELSELYPELYISLKYDEPGIGFMGVTKSDEGSYSDNCVEY